MKEKDLINSFKDYSKYEWLMLSSIVVWHNEKGKLFDEIRQQSEQKSNDLWRQIQKDSGDTKYKWVRKLRKWLYKGMIQDDMDQYERLRTIVKDYGKALADLKSKFGDDISIFDGVEKALSDFELSLKGLPKDQTECSNAIIYESVKLDAKRRECVSSLETLMAQFGDVCTKVGEIKITNPEVDGKAITDIESQIPQWEPMKGDMEKVRQYARQKFQNALTSAQNVEQDTISNDIGTQVPQRNSIKGAMEKVRQYVRQNVQDVLTAAQNEKQNAISKAGAVGKGIIKRFKR